jgi:hypothetical protein
MANRRRSAAAAADEQTTRGERATESFAAATAKGTQAWLVCQSDLLREYETASRGFVQRSREAIEDTQRAFEELQESRDMIEAMKIHQRIVSDTMQRAVAELSELSVTGLTLSQRAIGGMLKTGRSLAEDTREAQEFALDAAGSKPNNNHRRKAD